MTVQGKGISLGQERSRYSGAMANKGLEDVAVELDSRSGGRLSGRLYEIIKARLLEGKHAPGTKLSVVSIRQEFGVSKQPVMEALRLLAGDGLIEIRPQIGSVVSSYSTEEMHDFFHMFAGLEGAVAGVAARRRTPEAVRQLREVSAEIRALSEKADVEGRAKDYLTLNRRFHDGIRRMAASRIIADTSRRMWDISDFLISTAGYSGSMGDAVDDRQDDHDHILEALAEGDEHQAKSLMEAHILGTIDILEGYTPTPEA